MDINLYLDLLKKVDANEQFGFWMGGNDLEREDFFIWLDGSKGKFTNKCMYLIPTAYQKTVLL